MANLDITPVIGGYLCEWKAEQVSIRVTRLRLHTSDSRVTGQLRILNPLTNLPIYPPEANFNFTSDRVRNQLIKSLSAQDNRNWDRLIKELSEVVVSKAQEGEPLCERSTSEDVPAPTWLLEPIMQEGLPTILFGEKGVAKSTTALLVYLCLSLPWTDNPLGWTCQEKPTRVAILDYELPGNIALWNLKRLQLGMELPNVPFFHRHCLLPLAHDIEQTAYWLDKFRVGAIIIDSLARACGGDLLKTEEANAFFEALDSLKLSSFILAQTSKDSESKKKTIYGNALFTYYARNIFELCRSDFSQQDEIEVALFHRWSNLSKTYPDQGFRFSFNGNGTHIESQPVSVAEFIGKVNTQKAILDALKSGPMSAVDLAKTIGAPESSVRVILSRLKRRGLVLNPEKGLWGLIFNE